MFLRLLLVSAFSVAMPDVARSAEPNQPPEGFTALFDGKSLDGWWGWGTKHYKFYAAHRNIEDARMMVVSLPAVYW